MKRIGKIYALSLLLVLTGSAFAAPKVTQLPAIELNPLQDMVPNGEYEVFVQEHGAWSLAGSLSYDRFFRERELDLSKICGIRNSECGIGKDGTIRIRIMQKGGGAAHIDSMLLGGKPPEQIAGEDALAFRKLSKKDFDVLDAFGKSIELIFPAGMKNTTLALTARIEAMEISTVPFQYPLENLFKPMTESSHFYTYQLNDGTNAKPFLKEFYPSGSGHPSGTTYGWVTNDEKNLYVNMDFTADNTMDGGKDYAKVYVKTEKGLKEFKVSVPETTWGKADFTYTDKVRYQHKVYDFALPLSELGLTGRDVKKDLQIAFAAYGTASPPGDSTPRLAFDPDNNRYLLVMQKNIGSSGTATYDIYGQLINADGTLNGAGFAISSAATNQQVPTVAYDSANKRFLVAWHDFRNPPFTDIFGQLVNADGTLYGTAASTNFVICNAASNQLLPSIAFDNANSRFLVVWADGRSGNSDIFGQLVNADGSLYGTVSNASFTISNAASFQSTPAVAYDGTNKRFLVAWSDNRAGTSDIFGQLVNADGSLYSTSSNTNFAISNQAPANQSELSLAYDSVNQRYLVAWNDGRNFATNSTDIYGQMVNADGSLYSTASNTNFVISNSSGTIAGAQRFTSMAYDSVNQRYLVAWMDNRLAPTDIFGQLVNADGSLYGTAPNTNFLISSAATPLDTSAIAFNPLCSNFLVAYRSTDAATFTAVGLSLVGNPCETNPPTVSGTTPAPGATNIAANAAVTATFSEAMRASTVDATTFILKDSANSAVSGAVTYDTVNKIATFRPSSSLSFSTVYAATITTGVKDGVGNAMVVEHVWSFTTGATTLNTAPASPVLVSPANGQTGLSASVELRWNKSTDPDGDAVGYLVYSCTDQTFTGCTPVTVASTKAPNTYLAGLGASSLVFLAGLSIRGRKKAVMFVLLLVIALLIAGTVITACGSGGGGNNGTPVGDEMSQTVSAPLAGTTYFWKVVAADGKGGVSSSEVWSFTTQ